jgi:sulfite reductase (NADPH) flavoprotein alpha-component
MLDKTRQQHFDELISTASFEELIWMNGFLSATLTFGKDRAGSIELPGSSATAQAERLKITIAYGTETGNAKSLAGKLSAQAQKQGAITKTIALDQYRPAALAREQLLIIVISTQGDGEPPAAARKFYEHIFSSQENLGQLQYGVIALGDSAYPLFCQAGKDVDSRLSGLGATRIQPLQLCDSDYEDAALSWFADVLQILRKTSQERHSIPKETPATQARAGKRYYSGIIERNINLNDTGSEKQTHHIEIAAEGVVYEPGDSLGIVPQNPVGSVEAILRLAGASPDAMVNYRNGQGRLDDLLQQLNISCLPVRLVRRYAMIVGQEIPEVVMSLHDLLSIYPVKDRQQFHEVLQILEPIAPRLYSIASAPNAHEEGLHITVARNRFFPEQEARYGLCSDYLTTLPEGSRLSFYIHPNKRFRLPASETDMIMIGPGTGVAPFRSFLSERASTGAGGRNWLFFGDQRFTTDFLYQTEWQSLHEAGVLTRISTAFSRDQPEKIYVQHKLLEARATVFEWLEHGACIYICGAREPMSIDVERTLLKIISEQGNMSAAEASDYLSALETSGRYSKDVY